VSGADHSQQQSSGHQPRPYRGGGGNGSGRGGRGGQFRGNSNGGSRGDRDGFQKQPQQQTAPAANAQ